MPDPESALPTQSDQPEALPQLSPETRQDSFGPTSEDYVAEQSVNDIIERKKTVTSSLGGAALVYKDASSASLGLKAPVAEYDPLKGFTKAHRTKRPGFGEATPKPVDRSAAPTTPLQEMAVVRSNLRIDAINKREHEIAKFTGLYGKALLDKAEVKKLLDEGRYTLTQRMAIRRAGRYVRGLAKSNKRIYARLEKSAEGRGEDGENRPKRLSRMLGRIASRGQSPSSQEQVIDEPDTSSTPDRTTDIKSFADYRGYTWSEGSQVYEILGDDDEGSVRVGIYDEDGLVDVIAMPSRYVESILNASYTNTEDEEEADNH